MRTSGPTPPGVRPSPLCYRSSPDRRADPPRDSADRRILVTRVVVAAETETETVIPAARVATGHAGADAAEPSSAIIETIEAIGAIGAIATGIASAAPACLVSTIPAATSTDSHP